MNNKYKCGCCGQPFQEWDDVKITDEEVILTYKCGCGRYGAAKAELESAWEQLKAAFSLLLDTFKEIIYKIKGE